LIFFQDKTSCQGTRRDVSPDESEERSTGSTQRAQSRIASAGNKIANSNHRKRRLSTSGTAATAVKRRKTKPKLPANNSTLDIISRNIGTAIDLALEEDNNSSVLSPVNNASRLESEESRHIESAEKETLTAATPEANCMSTVPVPRQQQSSLAEGPGLLIGQKVICRIISFFICQLCAIAKVSVKPSF
jgi:hypothetical protein